jgi:hypothetical protein
MAVENDYNLLVHTINNIAESAGNLRAEVERCRLKEARDGLEPNETRWVQTLMIQLPFVSGPATQLEHGARQVLQSRPGEAVFDAQPPSAPDSL